MNYVKSNTLISFKGLKNRISNVESFSSSTGKASYKILSLDENKLSFLRNSSQQKWVVDISKLYAAYLELSIFNTNTLKRYVDRKQSPSLGLLVHLRLVKPV